MHIYSKSVHTNACNKQSDVCYLSYFHVHTAINILRCFGYPREHNFGLVTEPNRLYRRLCLFPSKLQEYTPPPFSRLSTQYHIDPLLILVCFLSILHERVCDYSRVQSSVTGILRMGDMNIHITWLTHVRTGPKKKNRVRDPRRVATLPRPHCRVSPYVIAARRMRLADVRRGDPRAKPCCKTFHLPRMCTGFRCMPPATRRSPRSFQGLPEFCCKTFPLYRMLLPGKVTINKVSLIPRILPDLSCSHGYMINSRSGLGTMIEPRGHVVLTFECLSKCLLLSLDECKQ